MKLTDIFICSAFGFAMAIYGSDDSRKDAEAHDPCAFAFKNGPVTSPEHMRFLMNSPKWPACQAKIDADRKADTEKFLNRIVQTKERCDREKSQSEECQNARRYLVGLADGRA